LRVGLQLEHHADKLEQLKTQVRRQIAFRHRAREDYLCRLRETIEKLEAEREHEREHFAEVQELRMHALLRHRP